jgi:hypothetical protein
MKHSFLTTVAVVCLAGSAFAEDLQHVSFKAPNGAAKYLVSESVEVGDAPGHVVRVFDTQAAITDKAATINGLTLASVWVRGTSDLTDGNGGGQGYVVLQAENGDTIYARANLATRRIGSQIHVTWSGAIYRGTGKFTGIQGVTQITNIIDSKPGGPISDVEYTVDYSIGK